MHADEPVTQPARRAGEIVAGLMVMILIAVIIAALALGGIWVAVQFVTMMVDAIADS